MSEHIVLVGFGNMGRALAAGWLAAAANRQITVVDPDADARDKAVALGLNAVEDGASISGQIDAAVLAVKPAEIDSALAGLPPARLVLSIAAGRSIAELASLAGREVPIVRAMPNTPAAIGLGMTGLCANQAAGNSEREFAASLMSAVGAVEWLDDEAQMDALTAVSGSGPAYVFLLIECLTAAAIDAGLDAELAGRLARETVRGAGAYAVEAGLDATSLRHQVTSPGGTTEAALAILAADDALPRLMREAVQAAADRSRELSRK